ncbi:integral membrane protein [Aspergillus californicus]
MEDLKNDLRMSMIIGAFTGISWIVGIEVNISLFLVFKRRRGLYFWSCAMISWAVIAQSLLVILADYGVWKDLLPAIILICTTWLLMVVPQSWVLYSRLHLLTFPKRPLRVIKYTLIFNSITFSVPTVVICVVSQTAVTTPEMMFVNLIWGRLEIVVYFLQETALSILYIYQTRKHLRECALLLSTCNQSTTSASSSIPTGRGSPTVRIHELETVLWQLIYAHALIVALDIAVLSIHSTGLYILHGAFKPCAYGVKLKVEFAILNRLRDIKQRPSGRLLYLRNRTELSQDALSS